MSSPGDGVSWNPAATDPVDPREADARRPGRIIYVTDLSERGRLDAGREATGVESGVQRLIADLVARFASAPPGAIDEIVVDGLRQIAEILQIDRAILWRKAAEDASAAVSHCWIRQPCPAPPEPLLLAAIPFIASRLEKGEATWFTRIEDVPDPVDRRELQRLGLRAAAVVPIAWTGAAPGARGVLAFGSMAPREWTPAIIDHFRVVSGVFGQALACATSHAALQRALHELQHLRERTTEKASAAVPDPPRSSARVRTENGSLCRGTQERLGTDVIVGKSAAIRRVLEQARQVAATNSTALLLGETGTGKELIATLIHEASARGARPMVRVNCSAIPSTLIESELFGREKGAFTGALARQIGRFELADDSTIFLDEIGDLPADVQVKLLRVIEERQVERLGSPRPVHVDVRIIAATHRNLEQRIAEDAFREDLFYRLNVFPIQVPALRERPEDIPLLVWRFVDEFSKSFGKRIDAIPQENMRAMQRYSWPGNIRELRNVVERAMIVSTGTVLTVALPVSASAAPAAGRSLTMVDVERAHLRSVLGDCRWRIRGAGGAADVLGLPPTTLETRMIKLGLSRPKPPYPID